MRRLERLQRVCSGYFAVWTSDLRRLASYTSVRLALVERSRFHLWATALVLSAVLAGTSRAAVYRVAPSGDDAARGTTEAPWKTLDKALASVKPGDIVELEAETYTFAPPKTALADKMVTIRPTAKAAGKVVLQGRFTDYEGQSSFLRFEGLASDDKPLMDLWKAHFARMQKEVVPPNPPNRGDGRAERSESPTEQSADVEKTAPSALAPAPASAGKALSRLSFSEAGKIRA